MTLVQTLFTQERIIEIADRRLTWPDDSVADDEYTKARVLEPDILRRVHRHRPDGSPLAEIDIGVNRKGAV